MGVKQSDVVCGSAYMHIFSSALSGYLFVFNLVFNPSTFKVIINMYDPITVFLVVWGLFSVGRALPSLVSCLEKYI